MDKSGQQREREGKAILEETHLIKDYKIEIQGALSTALFTSSFAFTPHS
jgi:hypothetical protein